MIVKISLIIFCAMFCFAQTLSAEKVWQAQNQGILGMDVRSISVFLKDDSLILAACGSSVYFSENKGQAWKKIFSLETEGGQISFVSFDQFNPEYLYAATNQGLFVRKSKNHNWRRIFNRVNVETQQVKWITFTPLNTQKIYLGTGSGLYVSEDSGASWKQANGGLPRSEVRSIAVHPVNSQVLYLANTYGLFKTIDSGQVWKRVYMTSYKISEDENEDGDEDGDSYESAEERQNLVNCIAIDQHAPKKVFIATGVGVFASNDAGESWNKLPSAGLGNTNVNFIVACAENQGAVYAATQAGVFEFMPELNRWQENYQGMTAREVHTLAANNKGKELWAGTDKGIFRTAEMTTVATPQTCEEVKVVVEIEENKEINIKQLLDEISLSEPTIREVQEAALRYAEVIHPDEIKALRRNAKLKAFLPEVSLDYDKTVSVSTNPNYKERVVGPRDWGLSFSWDVGDLIYSEQVRLIDSNARLQVQLRDDILNEVTRFYYERRKLQIELIISPPKTTEERLTKTLRLEELTANIDALTGSYFSRHLNSNGRNKQTKMNN